MKHRAFVEILNPFFTLPLLAAFLFHGCESSDRASGAVYRIEKQAERWVLLKDNAPFYIKGAVAGHYFDKINAYGGNAVRFGWNYDENMEKARENDLAVMVSLPVRPERDGMDWNDTLTVEKNIQQVMDIVKKFKDHPSVMFWALGNEPDWIPPGVPYNPKLWDWIDQMAVKIKQIDPFHPVMTVIGNSTFEKKIKEIAAQCPHLDLIGINLYGDFSNETEIVRKYWQKSYAVTEWGPHGHWQRPYTEWNAPLEECSSEKAAAYRHNYTQVIQKDSTHCLGSFVFFWDQKQEITHTWYGMFGKNGLESEAVNVMQFLWSGKRPFNSAPAVRELFINGKPRQLNLYLDTGEACRAFLDVYDAEDELIFSWEVKKEVTPAPYAGHGEIPAAPIEGLIVNPDKPEIRFKTPAQEGAYRLFGYAFDGQGHWAYANFPFYCR